MDGLDFIPVDKTRFAWVGRIAFLALILGIIAMYAFDDPYAWYGKLALSAALGSWITLRVLDPRKEAE